MGRSKLARSTPEPVMHVRFALLAALFPIIVGASPAPEVRHTYLVRLQGQSLVTHMHARVLAQNLAALDGGGKQFGRTLTPRAVYRYAGNGMALALTDAEAAQLATLPGVLGVRRERIEHPLTDAGPEWIGADKLWN